MFSARTGPRTESVEPRSVAEISTLPPGLDDEIDDVLSMLPLLDSEPDLADRVFSQLVDCLCEAVLHDIRLRHERGQTSRSGYLTEICRTVVALQERDLLGGGLPRSR